MTDREKILLSWLLYLILGGLLSGCVTVRRYERDTVGVNEEFSKQRRINSAVTGSFVDLEKRIEALEGKYDPCPCKEGFNIWPWPHGDLMPNPTGQFKIFPEPHPIPIPNVDDGRKVEPKEKP